MSYEAWGDNDGLDAEPLLEAGWWDPDRAKAVFDAIAAMYAEPIYEDANPAKGISVRFLMRFTILRDAAGVDVPEQFLKEARAALEVKS